MKEHITGKITVVLECSGVSLQLIKKVTTIFIDPINLTIFDRSSK